MVENKAKPRVISLVIYAAALGAVQYFLISPSFMPSEKVIWFYNGIASLLFGSRLLNPHFTPPADAATNGFLVVLAMLAASIAVPQGSVDLDVVLTTGIFGALILFVSLAVLIIRAPKGLEKRAWVIGVDHTVQRLGSPKVIYTVVVIVAAWLFHRDNPGQVMAILVTWTVILALEPVEGWLALYRMLKGLVSEKWSDRLVGVIAAYQSPGIFLIRQTDASRVPKGSLLFVSDDHGPKSLAVALNYVGRDEGNLLRCLSFPVPPEILPRIDDFVGITESGFAAQIELSEEEQDAIPADHPASILRRMEQFCGIVDEGTTIDFLQFEVLEDCDLSEGRLVETAIGEEPVLFQIIDGLTREEIVQQKNKYGYARARARKVGRWNGETNKIEPTPWLPRINAPVFLKEVEQAAPTASAIGHFPKTSFPVEMDVTAAVTHNTAILGILGVGKTFLAIELVERMIAEGVKVICLDLTNQYARELSDFIDADHEATKLAELQAACGRGAVHQNKEEGGSRTAFRAKVVEQFREFLSPDNDRCLRIYNPTQFEVWQQIANPYEGSASMASLTACEVTAIMSESALEISQEMGMTDDARVCLVYEEAHSLVPEWGSVAAEGDKTATAATARAILQGRKYGLGCLLITQRTANVTKTILNQCNTVFAMRAFDDTSKNFLSNYIGSDYTSVLPSLEERHAVIFGKASSCDNSVLIRVNDRPDFLQVFRVQNPPRPLPAQPVVEVPQEEIDDLDDEIPF